MLGLACNYVRGVFNELGMDKVVEEGREAACKEKQNTAKRLKDPDDALYDKADEENYPYFFFSFTVHKLVLTL